MINSKIHWINHNSQLCLLFIGQRAKKKNYQEQNETIWKNLTRVRIKRFF